MDYIDFQNLRFISFQMVYDMTIFGPRPSPAKRTYVLNSASEKLRSAVVTSLLPTIES